VRAEVHEHVRGGGRWYGERGEKQNQSSHAQAQINSSELESLGVYTLPSVPRGLSSPMISLIAGRGSGHSTGASSGV
jgi:hypothetical protein